MAEDNKRRIFGFHRALSKFLPYLYPDESDDTFNK
jgi:hypothetical protein